MPDVDFILMSCLNLAFCTEGGTFSMKDGSETTVSFVRPYQRRGARWEEYRWEFDLPIGLSAYLWLELVEPVPRAGRGPKQYRLALKPLEEAYRTGIMQATVAAAFNNWMADGARG